MTLYKISIGYCKVSKGLQHNISNSRILFEVPKWMVEKTWSQRQCWMWGCPPAGRLVKPRCNNISWSKDWNFRLFRDCCDGKPNFLLCWNVHHMVGLLGHEQCKHSWGGGHQVGVTLLVSTYIGSKFYLQFYYFKYLLRKDLFLSSEPTLNNQFEFFVFIIFKYERIF